MRFPRSHVLKLITSRSEHHARSARITFPGTGNSSLNKKTVAESNRFFIDGGTKDRTLGLRFWRPPLYQLSYTPKSFAIFESPIIIHIFFSNVNTQYYKNL